MKIQCNVCEASEAKVLCCADEAALCLECDRKVHAANKLASKHQRVPLSSSSSQMPKCDICQDTVGFFFCLEDRALLCRKCDVAIHTVNSLVSNHQRFLLTGVKVGPEPAEAGASSSTPKSSSGQSRNGTPTTIFTAESNDALPLNGGIGEFPFTKAPFYGGHVAGTISQWPIDELFGLNGFNSSYGFMGNGSSKADSSKHSGSSNSSMLRSAEEELEDNDCLGQVPETSWAVPQVPSPPTSSGLHWPREYRNLSHIAVSVPDVCFSTAQNSRHGQHIAKRRRHF